MAAAAIPALGWNFTAMAAKQYKIGSLAPKKGPFSEEALSFGAGVDLFLKENQDFLSRIRLINEDTGVNGARTIKALTDLVINLKVNFLLGATDLESTEQAIQAVKGSGIVMMAANPSARLVGGELCAPTHFRPVTNTCQESAIAAPWAIRNIGVRVFITGDDDQISNERGDFFANECEASGAKFVDRIMLKDDSSNLKDILEAIAQGEPDFVYASFKGRSAVEFIKGYKSGDKKIEAELLGPDCLTAYPGALNELKGLADGIKTITHLKTPSLLAQRLDKHGLGKDVSDINWSGAGFDSMALIDHAIRESNDQIASGKKLAKIISESTIESTRGKLQFDANNEPVLKAYLQEWSAKDKGFQHTIVAELGENRSPDFGCGNIGFPKSRADEDTEKEPTGSLPE
jgi:ABC-type branched-subunit amino acid transport system substrate-binding protein